MHLCQFLDDVLFRLFIYFKKLMQFELLICLNIIKISFADWIEIEFRFKT